MLRLKGLFANNKRWSQEIVKSDPSYFERLAQQQTPDYLWIGCSDSRVPANQIVGLDPGELFVHRNIANLVVHTDFNCLSVMQYAVDVLEVKHIIVCGHYNCGGVKAAMLNQLGLGLANNWLRHIQDVQQKHTSIINHIKDVEQRCNRLCELNVIEQVVNVCRTTVVQDAWERGLDLTIHGWVYGLSDGRLRDLAMCITKLKEVEKRYASTLRTTMGGLS